MISKRKLIQTSNSFSNVFIGMNMFFNSKKDSNLLYCNKVITKKIIDKTQFISKPKLFKSGMSLMPDFHTGLSKFNLTWIHDSLFNNELMMYGEVNGKLNYFKKFILRLASFSEFIITPSEHSKNELLQTFEIKDDKIIVMPYQIYTDNYIKIINNKALLGNVKKKINFNSQKFNIIFIGSPHYRKNLKQVVRVFSKLIDKKINAHLYVVSYKRKDIPLTFDLYSEIENNPNISLIGHISELDKICLLHSCDVLFNPTLMEGFGLPNIEAQICQTPVLSSNVSCVPEILEKSAVLHDPFDDQKQIDTLLRLYQDKSYANDLIQKGNKNILKYNNINRYQKLYDILNNF